MPRIKIIAVSVILIAIITALVFTVFRPKDSSGIIESEFKSVIDAYYKGAAELLQAILPTSQIAPITEQILAPTKPLSVAGILQFINLARVNNGDLETLTENSSLNRAALLRVRDMFGKQYFEHTSPSHEGVTTTAKIVGYQYLGIGENLALGNFESDEALVATWMASEGHRKNILTSHFTETGIAAERGEYQGEKTWIAVQVFGRPVSVCPAPSSLLKESIVSETAVLSDLEKEAQIIFNELENTKPRTEVETEEYNRKVASYNSIAKQINILNAQLKDLISKYNFTVRAFNVCLER